MDEKEYSEALFSKFNSAIAIEESKNVWNFLTSYPSEVGKKYLDDYEAGLQAAKESWEIPTNAKTLGWTYEQSAKRSSCCESKT